ncbi:unnamed protein product [Rotaria sp. Silwood1]|nr:unnamed protein product [Rotaria sp. Silwood1]CAF3557599.1 unnamed protein product [Rotaria sp. Silwood1]CAF3632283.1 unnamed protein product [Rotaria sp. Silwood1]CAF4627052.1 unnamed protein product [Rotaria sp. Silwood1]CAF4657211.1 unnamed protein product [Rotaria sp. Silwood1]
MQWFDRRIHFTGALDPIYWDEENEEIIFDQFQTIYNDRQNFLEFIEYNCNIEPFTIQSQTQQSSHMSSSEETLGTEKKRVRRILFSRSIPIDNGKLPVPNIVWPQPRYLNVSIDLVYIDPHKFIIDSSLKRCDVIDKAIENYKAIFHPSKLNTHSLPDNIDEKQVLAMLSIEIKSNKCEKYPTFHVDESYNITIEQAYGKIQANTIWGALHGLTTFSQLHFITDDIQLAINAPITIEDEPRFPYRGILLDSGRNFLRTSVIKKHLGTVSSDHVYTLENVQDIIEYARLRGIRIIPELNAPGHINALGRAFPDFLINCHSESTVGIINPTNTEIYLFIEKILREIKQIFEYESYIHLGMDEVYSACCISNLNIQEFMIENRMSKCTDLMTYYSSAILEIVQNIGAKPMVWQDVWDDGVNLPLDVVIEIWKDASWSTYLSKAINEGYNVVLAAPFNLSMYEQFDLFSIEKFI